MMAVAHCRMAVDRPAILDQSLLFAEIGNVAERACWWPVSSGPGSARA